MDPLAGNHQWKMFSAAAGFCRSFRDRLARDDVFGLFDAGDMPPFVGCAFAFGRAVGQAQQAGAMPFGGAGAAAFDPDQAERFDRSAGSYTFALA